MVTAAIILTIVIHTLGVPVMIWAVRGDQGLKGIWGWLPKDDEDGGGGSKLPDPPEPTTPSGGGVPLPESERPRTRLREHGDRVANPGRRPQRRTRPLAPEPDRAPVRPRR